MLNIIIFGPPGSGKGTQAKNLAKKYNLIHISTGDMFRNEMSSNTPLGKMAKEYISKGELVPDEITIGMLKNKINSYPKVDGYIFDGFPRTLSQASALDLFLEANNMSISLLLELDVSEEEIVERILKRGITSGRADDVDESIIRNRIQVYKKDTKEVFEYYDQKDKSKSISGVGSINAIFDRLVERIDSISCH